MEVGHIIASLLERNTWYIVITIEVDDIIASPNVLIASPLEGNTWSIVLIAMEVDDIIASPIVLIASPCKVLLFS